MRTTRSFFSLAPAATASLSLLALGTSSGAQSVELRMVERSDRSLVAGPSTAQLNLAVQARIVNAPSACFLASFGFSIRIAGEPEGFGSLARMAISNPDGTYSSAFAASSVVGRGGIAAQFAYLAGVNGSFNGVINTPVSAFTNTPDQEILSIAGVGQGAWLLGVPGLDLDGDGIPDTSPSNGAPSTANGTICTIPAPIRGEYFGASGSWVDIYRFRYTVSNFAPRSLVFKVENATGSIADSITYNLGLWGPCTGGGSFLPVTTDLAVSVFATAPAACCDPADGSCIVRPINECATLSVAGSSTCAANSCPTIGVCCDAGGCRAAYAAPCTGSWIAGGSCAANPCPPMGACCAPDNSCTTLPGSYCPYVTRNNPNAWRSGSCEATPCPQLGACCLNVGGCTLAPGWCSAGIYLGPLTTCGPDLCSNQYCCDLTTGMCQLRLISVACPAGWTPHGSGSVTCTPNPCPTEACCDYFSGHCSIIRAGATCNAPNYRITGAQACAALPCVLAVCCNAQTGACTTLPQSGGCPWASHPATSCTPSPCTSIACCHSTTGVCSMVGPAVACPAGTVSMGPGTCASTLCPTIVCCNNATAACSTIGPAGACPAGTSLQGAGTCSPTPCPAYLCCTSAGVCSVLGPASTCPGNLAPTGVPASCSPRPCPLAGKCCLTDGSCQIIVESLCTGQWTTTDNTCDQGPFCPPLVWCCSGTGQLTHIASFACTGIQIAAVGCNTHSCADAGACCTGHACAVTFASGCEAALGRAFKPLQTCGTGVTICCLADFDHDGAVAMTDLFAFLAAWMAGNSSTDFDQSGFLSVADVYVYVTVWSDGC